MSSEIFRCIRSSASGPRNLELPRRYPNTESIIRSALRPPPSGPGYWGSAVADPLLLESARWSSEKIPATVYPELRWLSRDPHRGERPLGRNCLSGSGA